MVKSQLHMGWEILCENSNPEGNSQPAMLAIANVSRRTSTCTAEVCSFLVKGRLRKRLRYPGASSVPLRVTLTLAAGSAIFPCNILFESG